MNAMQYKVTLPNDYDMNIIRERVKVNGSKTDGFTGLLLKAYLIIDTETRKEYSPFYLWNETQGMNKFIFEGFYDNILTSFGWQQINIAVPVCFEFSDEIATANYMLEIEQIIEPTSKLSTPTFSSENKSNLGKVIVYNPDKWKYVELYFFEESPAELEDLGSVYEVLHMSK